MRAGRSSLLRLLVALAAPVVVLAIGAPAVRAVAPDPSPAGAAAAPDPYVPIRPVVTRPPAEPPALVQTIPAPPLHAKASTPRATAKPVHARARTHAQRRRRVTTQTAAPTRIPDHVAPRLAALTREAVGTPRRASRGLTLTLAILVLLSASLVAGSARELAR